MKIQIIAFILGVLISYLSLGPTEIPLTLKTESGNIEGTLMFPSAILPVPLALIIAGSGPTDRNGNNPMMTNNSLKMLTNELANNGIAQSKSAGLKEDDLRFEMYINDDIEWISLLNKDIKFSQIVVVGHSEGSLIGMVAAQNAGVDKFVSLEGAGQPADQIIRDQLKSQPPVVLSQSLPIIDELVMGNTVGAVPPMLNSLFRPSVQPYMISWFKYDPQKEIAKLAKPVLIVQGTTDIQVSVDDAKRLHTANPDSKLVVIEGMNRVLKMQRLIKQRIC